MDCFIKEVTELVPFQQYEDSKWPMLELVLETSLLLPEATQEASSADSKIWFLVRLTGLISV
jgi:hypothetical protein